MTLEKKIEKLVKILIVIYIIIQIFNYIVYILATSFAGYSSGDIWSIKLLLSIMVILVAGPVYLPVLLGKIPIIKNIANARYYRMLGNEHELPAEFAVHRGISFPHR